MKDLFPELGKKPFQACVDFYENISGWQMQVTSADEKTHLETRMGKNIFFFV